MSTDSTQLRAVLLGKTGAGKSSTGNTLLGREAFRVARGLKSGTERCQWADGEIDGMPFQITDTPGLCDTHREAREVLREIGKSVAVTHEGPHVVLMVLRCDRRFTTEEYCAYRILKELFGESIKNFMIVVFVGADIHGKTLEEQKRGVKQDLQNASKFVKEVLNDVNNRYFAISNIASSSDKQRQANKLFNMMKELVQMNEGRCFRNAVCEEVGRLVEPLVLSRMQQNNLSRRQAEADINRAIVEETEDETLFDRMCVLMSEKVLPVLEKVLEVLNMGVQLAQQLQKHDMCSLM